MKYRYRILGVAIGMVGWIILSPPFAWRTFVGIVLIVIGGVYWTQDEQR